MCFFPISLESIQVHDCIFSRITKSIYTGNKVQYGKKKKKNLLLPIKTAAWKGSASFLPAITSHLKLYVLLISYKKKHLCLFFFFYTTRIKNNFLTITVTTNFKKVNCFQIGNTRHGKKCLLFVKISGLSLVNSLHLITEALKGQDNPIQRESNNHNVTY